MSLASVSVSNGGLLCVQITSRVTTKVRKEESQAQMARLASRNDEKGNMQKGCNMRLDWNAVT